MPSPGDLDNLHIILVRPQFPGNIGSSVRAMKNMGIQRLILVDPRTEITEESVRLAGKAADLLAETQIFECFDDAVESMHLLVAATSGRDRNLNQPVLSPRQAAGLIRQRIHQQRVGLVFGSERSGLPDDLLTRCQILVTIPAFGGYPVLNLAQAVMICCYEIYQASAKPVEAPLETVSQREREELFLQIREVLTRIGFLSSSHPQHVMKAIRYFWGGAHMSARDLRILRGIMSHIDWYVKDGYRLGPEGVRKP